MVKVRAFQAIENTIRRLGGSTWSPASTRWAAAAWPGPVVAAAVVLDPNRYIARICDSKTVTALERAPLVRQDHPQVDRAGGSPPPNPRDRHYQYPSGFS